MTKEEAISRLVTWANNQVGYPEGDNNWNKYAPIVTPLIGWNAQNQPWCDIFTDAGFVECFGLENASRMTYQPIGKGSAACRYSADFFKNNGAWSSTPHVGDVIFFYYDGGINHQGIVVDVSGGVVYTVEGNSSDMVARRAYAVGSSNIAGYGVPDWSVVSGSDNNVPTDNVPDINVGDKPATEPDHSYHAYTYNVAVSLLKKGDYGPQVLHMQQLLNANGFECSVDGRFGDQTFEALKAFQRAAGIGVDGEWGGESFRAMWNFKGASE